MGRASKEVAKIAIVRILGDEGGGSEAGGIALVTGGVRQRNSCGLCCCKAVQSQG
jgi:hypothetical protein